MAPALAMSDVVQCVVSSSLRLIQGNLTTGEIASHLATAVRDSPDDEQFRSRLVPLTTVLLPPSADGSFAEIERDALAWGLYGTILRLADVQDPSTDFQSVQELVQIAGQRLKREVIKESRPPDSLSGIFRSAPDLSFEIVERQMMGALKEIVLSTLHDANNFLAPLVVSVDEAKQETERLAEIVEKNRHHLSEDVRALVPLYVAGIDKSVKEMDSLLREIVQLIRSVQRILSLADRAAPAFVSIPRFFAEGGIMHRISGKIDGIHEDLVQGHGDLQRLFDISKSHGHLVPKDVFDDGIKVLFALEDFFGVFRDVVVLLAELLNMTKDVVAGIHQEPGKIVLDERLTLLKPRMMGAVMGKWVKLTLDLENDPRPVWGLPIHISQILLNTACNARDAMNRNGAFTITTRNVTLRPEDLEELEGIVVKPAAKTGNFLKLRLEDTGPGIPDTVLPRIFEIAFSGKGSSGLGLAVVLKIVREMGGFLTVETETSQNEARGTIFTVYLPAS